MLIAQAAASDSHRHTVVTLVQLAKTVDVAGAGRRYEFRIRALQLNSFLLPK
jgi:hypothetical protein